MDTALGRVIVLIWFPLNCDKTHIRCRGSGQEDVNWFEVVQPLQSVCHGEAGEGSKTETDQDRVQKMWKNIDIMSLLRLVLLSYLCPNSANGFSFNSGNNAPITSSTICCMFWKKGSLARLSLPGSLTANTGRDRKGIKTSKVEI